MLEKIIDNRAYSALVIILLLTIIIPIFGEYPQVVLITTFLFTSLALSWNLISGYTGYIDFGFAAWVGIGAYTFGIIYMNGVHFSIALFLAGLFCSLIAFGLGRIILYLRGAYFAIATMGFWAFSRILVKSEYLEPWTKGPVGFFVRSGLGITEVLYLAALLLIICVLSNYFIRNSRLGREMLAIKSDELATEIAGVNTGRVKRIAYSISAFFAGIVGGVFSIHLVYLSPKLFSVKYMLVPMISVIFGGAGTVVGPLIGGFIFSILKQLLWMQFMEWHMTFLGLSLILIMLYMPEGIGSLIAKKRKEM